MPPTPKEPLTFPPGKSRLILPSPAIQYPHAQYQNPLRHPPPDMLKRAQSIAKKESRTMSELIREALRHYERRSWWDDVNAYGRA